MKKLIALVLILVVINVILISSNYHYSNSEIYSVKFDKSSKHPKDVNWEYIKVRLFENQGKNMGRPAKKFTGPIFFSLKGALHQDSLVVDNLIQELKLLLPNKDIDFTGKRLKDCKEEKKIIYPSSPEITLNFYEKSTDIVNGGSNLIFSYLEDGNVIFRNRRLNSYTTSFNYTAISFYLNKEISSDSRKHFIRYEILRSLCLVKNNAYDNSTYEEKGIFNRTNFDPSNYRFTEADKFLLQKLYSDDFLEQFKKYLYDTYPRRYADAFLNKKMADRKAMLIVLGLGILVLILMFSYFQKKTYKYSFLNYFSPVLFIWLYYININWVYDSLTDSLRIFGWVSNILFELTIIPLITLITSFIMWFLEKRCINESTKFSFQLLLKTVFTFIAFSFPIVVIFLFDGHIDEGLDFFFLVLFLWVALSFGRGLLIYLNHFSDSLIKEKDVELSKLKQVNAEAEVRLLQSQINPHFLYNALNSIASLALVDGEKTQKMTYSLSNLFKYSINRKGKKTSTIGDEVKMVQNYLEIEKIRFGERLQFTIEVDTELEKVEIPLFIIQPLVENAIKHGISKIEGNGKIALKIEKREKEILITIKDNGPHFSEGLVNGHGLQTVYDLLYLSYGEKASLNWQNTPEKHIAITIQRKRHYEECNDEAIC